MKNIEVPYSPIVISEAQGIPQQPSIFIVTMYSKYISSCSVTIIITFVTCHMASLISYKLIISSAGYATHLMLVVELNFFLTKSLAELKAKLNGNLQFNSLCCHN